jgi:hypothetical protein
MHSTTVIVVVVSMTNRLTRTLFTPESAEARLGEMNQMLSQFTGPDATFPIPGGSCKAKIEDAIFLTVEGIVSAEVARWYGRDTTQPFSFRRVDGKTTFTRTIIFEEDCTPLQNNVDVLLTLHALHASLVVYHNN